MVLGVLAIIASRVATFAVVVTFGVLLLFGGILRFIHAFRVRKWGGILLSIAVGALYLVTGLLLLANPRLAAFALTLVMALFFITIGLFRTMAALTIRFPSWGWVLTSGLISLILGVIVWMQLPSVALWVIGLFVGIDMVFDGWSLVFLGLCTRSLPEVL
jgi:uncharacterized membrane protein HdeD (DUF308 family)